MNTYLQATPMKYGSLSELYELANNGKIKKVKIILDPHKKTQHNRLFTDLLSLNYEINNGQKNGDLHIEISDITQDNKNRYGPFQPSGKIDTVQDLVTVADYIAANLKLCNCEVYMHSEPYNFFIRDKLQIIANPKATTKRLVMIHD